MKAFVEKIKRIVILLIFILVAIAIISYFSAGEHTNPKITNVVKWDSPETKKYFYAACADCHSHETKWPWYSHFAPISQMIIDHVDSGRKRFNISIINMGRSEETALELENGHMPPQEYIKMHPEAMLNKKEKSIFARGLKKTFPKNKSK